MRDRFDLNKHAWVEQPCDDDHRRRRRILGEDLPVGAPDVLPMLWANEVHPRLDNMRQVGACLSEHHADLVQSLLRLRVWVVAADDGTRAVNGSCLLYTSDAAD